jgi:hypothetical protein
LNAQLSGREDDHFDREGTRQAFEFGAFESFLLASDGVPDPSDRADGGPRN